MVGLTEAVLLRDQIIVAYWDLDIREVITLSPYLTG